jgi:hypothetical protein
MGYEAPVNPTNPHPSNPQERRQMERRRLLYYLRAWDKENSELLGHIVDFTSEGLMLISEEPIHIGGEYSLEVRLPDSQGDMRPISLKAVCRWSVMNAEKSFFDAGFEVVEKSSEEFDTLHAMTNAYGFGI